MDAALLSARLNANRGMILIRSSGCWFPEGLHVIKDIDIPVLLGLKKEWLTTVKDEQRWAW